MQETGLPFRTGLGGLDHARDRHLPERRRWWKDRPDWAKSAGRLVITACLPPEGRALRQNQAGGACSFS